jgi:hypothetical protein
MIQYAIAQAVRLVCIVLVVVLPDWWKIAPAIGAVFIPYFAVVVANNVRRPATAGVRRPGAVVRRAAEKDAA